MKWTAAAIALCWFTFVAVWIGAAVYYRSDAPEGRSQLPARRLGFRLVAVCGILAAFGLRHVLDRTFGSGVEVAGVVVCAAGIAFAAWARVTLGRSWGMPMTVRSDRHLVTGGPYRWVRHPIYSGVLLAMIGSTMGRGLVWLPALIGVVAYILFTIGVEERDMTGALPDEYRAYVGRTKRLIPFVY